MPTRQNVRNPVARSPLLRKGGPHIKSTTGQRQQTRQSTQNMVDEWLDELDELQQEENGEPKLPDFFSYSPNGLLGSTSSSKGFRLSTLVS